MTNQEAPQQVFIGTSAYSSIASSTEHNSST